MNGLCLWRFFNIEMSNFPFQYLPLKNVIVKSPNKTKKQNACSQQFHLKCEGLFVIDVDFFAQIKQFVIDCLQLVDEGWKLFSFDKRAQKAGKAGYKADYDVHELPCWK